MTYRADEYRASSDRSERTPYRRRGRTGLDLPAFSLGLWHNLSLIVI